MDSQRLALSKNIASRLVRQSTSIFGQEKLKGTPVLNKKAAIRHAQRLKKKPQTIDVNIYAFSKGITISVFTRQRAGTILTKTVDGEYDEKYLGYTFSCYTTYKSGEVAISAPEHMVVTEHAIQRWFERREGLTAQDSNEHLLKTFEHDLFKSILGKGLTEVTNKFGGVVTSDLGKWVWLWSSLASLKDGKNERILTLKTFLSPEMEIDQVNKRETISREELDAFIETKRKMQAHA
ncbi:hypothetical protein [Ruegeria sp. HKCCSP335]|uniref:hypothetical protein n=1 Tax=Ruegeria sp. HKCCSP335 TaxID=2794833 RepID=UPI001AE17147|nr:hypothetical protein [Ruegeria sp. HKCCSP335]